MKKVRILSLNIYYIFIVSNKFKSLINFVGILVESILVIIKMNEGINLVTLVYLVLYLYLIGESINIIRRDVVSFQIIGRKSLQFKLILF